MQKAEALKLNNIKFILFDATKLNELLPKHSVSTLYLNFSDPWPKKRHEKRRLTSREFLERYKQILKPGCTVEFKTDNTELFNFSLEEVQEAKGWNLEHYTYDLHHFDLLNEGNVMTEYEEKFSSMGNPINKLIARLEK